MIAYAVALALAAAPAGGAQTPSQLDADLAAVRVESTNAHLARVAGWAAGNVVAGGAVLVLAQDAPAVQATALQGLAWGGINLAIVGAGLLFPSEANAATALDDERFLGDVLLVNLGLDVGYMMAGGALVGAALAGDRYQELFFGTGVGIMGQGLGLFVLDAIAWWGSHQREDALAQAPRG